MKKIIIPFLIMFLFMAVNTVNAQAKIEFKQTEHNYGDINAGGNGECVFTFTNTGDQPLVLKAVRPSCSCVEVSYGKGEIAPGATNVIKVKYDTNKTGQINKSITVMSNGNKAPVILRLKGMVNPK